MIIFGMLDGIYFSRTMPTHIGAIDASIIIHRKITRSLKRQHSLDSKMLLASYMSFAVLRIQVRTYIRLHLQNISIRTYDILQPNNLYRIYQTPRDDVFLFLLHPISCSFFQRFCIVSPQRCQYYFINFPADGDGALFGE